ncbi:hypothetical protein AAC387_Pa05g0229 [Persea americana]
MPSSHRCSVLPVIHLRSSHPSPEKRFGGPLIPGLPIIKGSRVVSGFVSVHHPYSSRNRGEKEEIMPCRNTSKEEEETPGLRLGKFWFRVGSWSSLTCFA